MMWQGPNFKICQVIKNIVILTASDIPTYENKNLAVIYSPRVWYVEEECVQVSEVR